MTDLSPAAQQVFWEFNRAASGKPDDWHYLPAIAAALRAAADHLEQSFPFPYEDEGIGVDWAVSELQDIADELEQLNG
jgi:hypothetical protein